MAQFQNNFAQDLTQKCPVRTDCGLVAFNADNLSNVVSVALYNGEEAYSGGGTVVGAVVCPDGATVALDGTLSGNVASITLTGDCFALQGQIGVSIQIVNGETRTTVLKAIYNVDVSSTDTIVDPGSRITLSLAEIQAELDEIPTILANAQTAIDGIEAQKDTMIASIASVAGQGTDTTLTQSGVAADAKATGDQITDLKSALEQAIDDFAVPTQEAVDNWLTAHPEATTTVQDESLTETKFSDALKLKTIKDYVTPEMFGAKGDGVTDDTVAFSSAFEASNVVVLGKKNYYVPDLIVPSGKQIIGVNNGNAGDCTIKTNGVVLNGRTVLSHICFTPASAPHSAIVFSGSYIRVDNCYVSGAFRNGFYFDDSKYTGNIIITGCIVYGCTTNGLYIVSYTAGTLANNVEIDGCYFSTIGTNASDYTAESTKTVSGHGIQIDGGHSISIRNTVVEYSSGIGIFLRANVIDLSGIVISAPYFEHNKYANLYVENKHNSKGFYNVDIGGEFYSDGGVGLPADALANRELVVVNNTELVYTKALTPETNNFSAVSKKARFTAHPLYPNNVFPYDRVGDIVSEYETIVDEDGKKALQFNHPMFDYAMSIPIIGGVSYTMKSVCKLVGTGTASFGLAITPVSGGSTQYALFGIQETEWTQKDMPVSVAQDSVARLYIESVNAEKIAYVKDIRIIPS